MPCSTLHLAVEICITALDIVKCLFLFARFRQRRAMSLYESSMTMDLIYPSSCYSKCFRFSLAYSNLRIDVKKKVQSCPKGNKAKEVQHLHNDSLPFHLAQNLSFRYKFHHFIELLQWHMNQPLLIHDALQPSHLHRAISIHDDLLRDRLSHCCPRSNKYPFPPV